jgi:hypothetical protein
MLKNGLGFEDNSRFRIICEMIINLEMKALSTFEMSMGVDFDDV